MWKKVGNGAWQPLTDDSPTLSIGALAVDPSHGLWVGTGEANTSSDSYAGIVVLAATSRGLYRHSATTLTGAWTPVLAAGVGLPDVCVQSGGVDGKAFVTTSR